MFNDCSFHTTSRKVRCRGDHLKDLYNQVNKGHVSYCQKYLPSSKLFESSVQSVTHEKNTSKTYKKTSNQEVTPDVFTQIQRANKKKRSSENLSVENVQMYDMHVTSISPEKKNCLDLTSPSCLIADDRQLKKLQNPSLAILSLRKETAQLQKRYLCLEFGCIIWGKMSGYRPWPGLTIAGELVGKNNSPGSTWIFWFGDHKISNINNSKISRFDQKYFYNSKKFMLSKKFKNALNEALQLCAVRAGVHIKENNAQYLHLWAEKQFQELENFDHDPFAPAGDEEYPVFVLQILEKFQPPKLNDSEQTMHPQNEMSCLLGMSADKASSKVKLKNVKIQEICLCCDSLDKELVAQHPLFEGGLCQECKDFILGTTFALDPDNSHAFCAICCHGGEVCICCLVQCGRVYCKSCIQNWVSDSAWEKILVQDPWVCFLCNTQVSVATHGCLKPKRSWNINIIQLFLSHQQLQEPDLSYLMNDPTPPPLRVLSLFDGIGTGKVALDELGIVTNGYFSSEIDLDALIVTRVNHGNNVTEIGDITQLTEKRISELCPIDLVIGGSPCNELSLVNPARKGFSEAGTGILFFEFYRVLNIVQKLCKDRHVFWLFENVTAMKSEYKAIISRYLGCQPALWDAKYFSPQQRARYFWGNIPTIYSMPPVLAEENLMQLNSVLSPNCHRKAMVKQLRTVTTCANSLRQGKKENILPVEMDGEEDNVWITELEKYICVEALIVLITYCYQISQKKSIDENVRSALKIHLAPHSLRLLEFYAKVGSSYGLDRIFGFPPHYTDVRNFSYGRRQRLLGKAWSVPVIKFLLSPLCDIFGTM